MREFELTFLLKPHLDDAKVDEIVQRVREIIAKGGEPGETKIWGKRHLAYPIQDLGEAIYVFQPFTAAADVPLELQRFFGLHEDVLRHLTVHAIPEPPVVEPRVVTRKTEIFIPAKAVKDSAEPGPGESAAGPVAAAATPAEAAPEQLESRAKGVEEGPGEDEEETLSAPEATPEG